MSAGSAVVELVRLGRMRYLPALEAQSRRVDAVKREPGRRHFLLIVEHEPVYTVGIRRRKEYSSSLREKLERSGADYVEASRGGLITFHGPGQLVAYPILDLRSLLGWRTGRRKELTVAGMRWYVQTLEQTVVDLLKGGFGIESRRSPHTGVWVGPPEGGADEKKICAVGVRSSDLVTSHGIALNCNVDLARFDRIVPCGIEGKGVSSVSREVGADVGVETVLPELVKHFQLNFRCRVVDGDPANEPLNH